MVVGVFLVEFASQDWLMNTLEGVILDDKEECASLAEDLDTKKGIAMLVKNCGVVVLE